MRKIVESGARGVSNGKGFYNYSEPEAKRWEDLFTKFNYEIRKLTAKYSTQTSAPIEKVDAKG